VLVHDEAGGRLWNGPGREPWLTYRMAPGDKRRFLRGIEILSEAFLASGAKELLLPIYGHPPVKTMDEVRAAVAKNPPGRLLESISFHPLGSARMSVYERDGVVRPTGESWDLPGLWIADGSIFPTSIGVNSQLPIMAMATRIAEKFLAQHRV
jgi:choline dehydrogenase-like flavoprotein